MESIATTIRGLTHEDAEKRKAAAEKLGKLGSGEAVEPLIAALADKNKFVAHRAVEALGKIGDARALTPLLEVLRTDERDIVRSEAVEALGQWGSEEVIDALLYTLANDTYEHARSGAATVLVNFPSERVTLALLQALSDRHVFVQTSAINALCQCADTRAVEPIRKIYREIELPHVDARNDLSSALWDLSNAAARALGKLGDRQAVPLLTANLRNKPGMWNREEEARALGYLGDESTLDVLENALFNDSNWRAGYQAAISIGRIGGERAFELLLKALRDHDYGIRAGAAEGLAVLKNPRAAKPLRAALKRKDIQNLDTRAIEKALDALGDIPHDTTQSSCSKEEAPIAPVLGHVGQTRHGLGCLIVFVGVVMVVLEMSGKTPGFLARAGIPVWAWLALVAFGFILRRRPPSL